MTAYELMKTGHVSCVAISLTLFVFRFGRLNLYLDKPLSRAFKIFPHINDTLLLVFAIGLVMQMQLRPFDTPWLEEKILSLLVYIVLGAICMRSRPRSRQQALTFVAALGVFAYMLFVAVSKRTIMF